jgi:dUTP pyrophosphatase|nr:MAG TPA: deoxyuridine 5'-triphosphate nucleotidohydrolase [Crassvirales sp.]
MNEVNVKIKKLVENAVIPTYAKPGDMGMDLVATSMEYDVSRDCYVYHTGLAFEVPEGYGMLLFPRSSNRNTEAYMTNHVGILDSGYRGELLICYKLRTSKEISELIVELTHALVDVRNDVVEIVDNISDANIAISSNYKDNELIEIDWEESAPYKVGDRVAQLVVIPYPKVIFEEVEELSASERGTGGHGSTGK